MTKMLGRTHRPRSCKYDCCRKWHTGHKNTHKIVRKGKRREERAWQKEIRRG